VEERNNYVLKISRHPNVVLCQRLFLPFLVLVLLLTYWCSVWFSNRYRTWHLHYDTTHNITCQL